MIHYVCLGDCGSVIDEFGLCESSDCSQNGLPLEKCKCSDGLHSSLFDDLGEETDNNM
ncbi:MAG: hypothetical protein WCO21_02230 [bacterium]|nr:hypothetical protein [Candidatus Jorgensenbacteria bacterium]